MILNRNVGSRLYNLHAIVPVSVFGLSTLFRVFHDPLLAATEQAATCDARPSDRLCILAIILSLCGGPATEQANKSGGTLATTQSIHDSAEKSHIASVGVLAPSRGHTSFCTIALLHYAFKQ